MLPCSTPSMDQDDSNDNGTHSRSKGSVILRSAQAQSDDLQTQTHAKRKKKLPEAESGWHDMAWQSLILMMPLIVCSPIGSTRDQACSRGPFSFCPGLDWGPRGAGEYGVDGVPRGAPWC